MTGMMKEEAVRIVRIECFSSWKKQIVILFLSSPRKTSMCYFNNSCIEHRILHFKSYYSLIFVKKIFSEHSQRGGFEKAKMKIVLFANKGTIICGKCHILTPFATKHARNPNPLNRPHQFLPFLPILRGFPNICLSILTSLA